MSRTEVGDVDTRFIKSTVSTSPCIVSNWISYWQYRKHMISNKAFCLKRLVKHKVEINNRIHSLGSLYMLPHRNPNVSYTFMSPSFFIASNSVISMHSIPSQKRIRKNHDSKLMYFVTGIKEKWRKGIKASIRDSFASKLYTDPDKLQPGSQKCLRSKTRLNSLLQFRLLSCWSHLSALLHKFTDKVISTRELYQGIYSKVLSIYVPLSTTLSSYNVATTFEPKGVMAPNPMNILDRVHTSQLSEPREARLATNKKGTIISVYVSLDVQHLDLFRYMQLFK